MPRIRTIKPEFPQSESMGRVSREARLCFVLLFTLADDVGRLRGHSRLLASLLYPYDRDVVENPALVDGWLDELVAQKCIVRYKSGDESYIAICKWLSHQKIDKPSKSKLPAFDEPSRTLANPLEPSGNVAQDQGRDQGKDQGGDATCIGARKGKEEQGFLDPPVSAPESPDDNFDGQEWCLKTLKVHPLFYDPDAVDVSRTISDAYIEAVEVVAKKYHGNRLQAAEEIHARTVEYARKVKAGEEKALGTLASYFKGEGYRAHKPVSLPSAPKPKLVEKTLEEELTEGAAAIRRDRAKLFPGLKKAAGE